MEEARQTAELEALLEYIRAVRGFDFSGYKRTTLARRIQGRMEQVGAASYAEYRELLEAAPGEFDELFNAVLINLTGFFRDRESWEYLASNVLPEVIERKSEGEPIRAWCVGCASGEEAYTLAMVMAEQLASFEDLNSEVLRIYGTDLDEEALARARAGQYAAATIESVPPAMRERFMVSSDSAYLVRADIRRMVIFGRHDLLRDSPISSLDVVICRNTLMYFNTEAQLKAVARLHFALRSGGIAFLGRAEMLRAKGSLFEVVSLEHRIFRKAADTAPDPRWWSSGVRPIASARPARQAAAPEEIPVPVRAAAQLFFDLHGRVTSFNQEAQRLFALEPADIDRTLQDLALAWTPTRLLEPINRAARTRDVVWIENVPRPLADQQSQIFDVLVVPLMDAGGEISGTSVTFLDMTADYEARRKLEQAMHERATVQEELQSSNEELETTNDELRSANDRLEIVNQELQATNRELHLANEDLIAANAELRARSDELATTRAILDSLLISVPGAVAAADRELRILLWSTHAENLFGVRAHEAVDRHLFSLETGLPVERLVELSRAALRQMKRQQEIVPARDAAGRRVTLRITFVPLRLPDRDAVGLTVLFESAASPMEPPDEPS